MPKTSCRHTWEMINIHYGFIVTEKCYTCEKISTYYSFEDRPPLDEYREGEHFWNVMESAQSFRFDFKCRACGQIVPFDELMGLMMCTGCDEECQVEKLQKKHAAERTWIYVAFGFLPTDEHRQLSREKISILEDFFNQRRKSSTSRIKIVSQELVKKYATCFGEVIKDVDMLSLKPSEGK